MVELAELAAYLDRYLGIHRFRDYCPNGLQVEGRTQVKSVVSGVSACAGLIEAAAHAGADAVLVHHGYFWKGEPRVLTGMRLQRIRCLIESGMSLLAYHLPLDAHPQLGNNACLADRLGIVVEGVLDSDQEPSIAMLGRLDRPVAPVVFARTISRALQREPLWIAGGPGEISTVGWCTGAAQDYIHHAIRKKLDAFISGEVSERTTHIAREEGIHYFACGHHATERYGVQRLGEHISEKFSLQHRFIDVDNPV